MGFKVKDHYYNKAKKKNYLARSIFKLEEIDHKFGLLEKTDSVVDLGYYPGSWIQYASKIINDNGTVVGVDIQEVNNKISSLKNVKLFCKDVFSIASPEDLGVHDKFDVVLSDMAPKTCGIKEVDQARSLELVEKVFSLLPTMLKEGGNLVIKVFDSHDAQEYLAENRKHFELFKNFKPKSTRSVSKEFFVIGKGYKIAEQNQP